jgi:hypothetical protein
MAPGPVRWPWIASSVASETFPAGVRFRGWMSEAEGFLCSRLPASLRWPARPRPIPLTQSRPSWPLPRSQPEYRPAHAATGPSVPLVSPIACISQSNRFAHASGDRDSTPVSGGQRPVSRRPARPTYPVSGRLSAQHSPSPAAYPPNTPRLPVPSPADLPGLPAAPIRAACGGAPGRSGWPGSWQRIDGVSRLLPYSDLLALTSSKSARGGRVRPRLMEAIAYFANRTCRCSCRA